MYKLTNSTSITRISDGASIPNDPDNGDYRDYLEYVKKGGVVAPADIPAPPTYQQLRAAAYPPITGQLDTLFHGGLEAWKAEIQAVKNKYPKGGA